MSAKDESSHHQSIVMTLAIETGGETHDGHHVQTYRQAKVFSLANTLITCIRRCGKCVKSDHIRVTGIGE